MKSAKPWLVGFMGLVLILVLAVGWVVGRARGPSATSVATGSSASDLYHDWARKEPGGPVCRGEEDGPAARMFLFYAADCDDCRQVLDQVLPSLRRKYGAQMQARLFDVDNPTNRQVMLDLERSYGAQEEGLPVIFIADQVLAGSDAIRQELEPAIRRALVAGGVDWPSEALPAGSD